MPGEYVLKTETVYGLLSNSEEKSDFVNATIANKIPPGDTSVLRTTAKKTEKLELNCR